MSKGSATSYVLLERFKRDMEGIGYSVFVCEAERDFRNPATGDTAIWNVLAVKNTLGPRNERKASIQSDEWVQRRCIVGAEVALNGQTLRVATTHLTLPTSNARSRKEIGLQQVAVSQFMLGSNVKNSIVLGDFNSEYFGEGPPERTSRYLDSLEGISAERKPPLSKDFEQHPDTRKNLETGEYSINNVLSGLFSVPHQPLHSPFAPFLDRWLLFASQAVVGTK